MEAYVLETKKREKTGKEIAKKLRRKGLIPAVLYGHKGTKALSVRDLDFKKMFEKIGEHSIISLDIEGDEKAEVIVKDFQLDPVKRNIIHVDFFEIERGKVLRTEVPIKIVGVSKGVKKGGILELFLRDLEIECLPKDIPESITINIEELDLGDSLHVRDIEVGPQVTLISNPEQVVVTIGSPTVIKVPVAEEEKVAEVAVAPAEGEIPPETEKTE
jgi:large subunit ribosomal protein L25